MSLMTAGASITRFVGIRIRATPAPWRSKPVPCRLDPMSVKSAAGHGQAHTRQAAACPLTSQIVETPRFSVAAHDCHG